MTDTRRCPNCQGSSWWTLGVTPAGRLDRCEDCGEEAIVPDVAAAELAAQRDTAVADVGAERVFETVVGPMPTGEVVRLRHGDQVAALVDAATHAVGTPESVALCLRASGYEIVSAPVVRCSCPTDGETGRVLRNPVCSVHGDVETVAVSGG